MTKISVKSKSREITGKKIKKYRKEGLIPAVAYGRKITPRNLWVDYLAFEKAYEKAGESTLIELEVDGGSKVNALIQEIQVDPITSKYSHIDFFQVRMDEKIETEVPLEFIGESPAVKESGGMLVKNMEEIPVRCLPADLPSRLEVNISVLKTFDDNIKVKNLNIPEKVEVMLDLNLVVAIVAPLRSEEELDKLNEKVEENVEKVEGVAEKVPEEKAKAEEKKEKKEKK